MRRAAGAMCARHRAGGRCMGGIVSLRVAGTGGAAATGARGSGARRGGGTGAQGFGAPVGAGGAVATGARGFGRRIAVRRAAGAMRARHGAGGRCMGGIVSRRVAGTDGGRSRRDPTALPGRLRRGAVSARRPGSRCSTVWAMRSVWVGAAAPAPAGGRAGGARRASASGVPGGSPARGWDGRCGWTDRNLGHGSGWDCPPGRPRHGMGGVAISQEGGSGAVPTDVRDDRI